MCIADKYMIGPDMIKPISHCNHINLEINIKEDFSTKS